MKSLLLTLLLASAIQAQGIKPMNHATGEQFGYPKKIAVWAGYENQYQQSDFVCRIWVVITELPEINYVWKDHYEIGDSVALRADWTLRMEGWEIWFDHNAILGLWVDDPKLMAEWLWGID